ncbi:MAG: tail fiber protein [Oscillospiraceae bacterium]|nr:tail fiber protein [Oscillospiraceae bacterium]
MNIEFTIAGQRISVTKDSYIIANSVGYVTFTCTFDDQWDGLSKYAVFTNGDTSRSVLITSDEYHFVPHETLKKGRLYASFIGLSPDGEKKLTTGKMLFPMIVLESGAQDGTESQVYEPSVLEQVISVIGNIELLATDAKTDVVSAINELASGGGRGVCYGTCDTSGMTREKTVACPGFELYEGSVIFVKFANAQSCDSSAASPIKLNVNGTGARPAMAVGAFPLQKNAWQEGEAVGFVYDGTNWQMITGAAASTAGYGRTMLSTATNSNSTYMAATPSAVKNAYDLASSKTTVQQVNALIEAYINSLNGDSVSY